MTSGANVIPGPHIQMSVGKVGTRKKVCSNTSDAEFSSDFLSLFFFFFLCFFFLDSIRCWACALALHSRAF